MRRSPCTCGTEMKTLSTMVYFPLAAMLVVACGEAQPVTPDRLEVLQNPRACPPGSDMDASAQANLDCSGKAGVEVKSQSGSIQAKCGTANGYAVKCIVNTSVCKYGAKTMTAEKLECADPPPPPPVVPVVVVQPPPAPQPAPSTPSSTACEIKDCGITNKTGCQISCASPKQARCSCDVCGVTLGIETCKRENCRCE